MKLASRFMAIAGAALAAISTAQAQRAPRIGYVYPAGGQQGQTVEITVGGQGLAGATGVHFTGQGVEAEIIGFERPLSGKETELLREKLKQLEDEKKASAKAKPAPNAPEAKPVLTEAEKEIAEVREKIAKFGNGPPHNVAIADNLKLRVTLAPGASLGDQEIRLTTPGGLSNPLVFCVGQAPEFSEPAARGSLKAEIDSKPRGKRRRDNSKLEIPEEKMAAVALPVVFNGQILPGEEDRFRFLARKGQRVVVAASARKLIPYLADAVPGWFQATIAIHDAQGREIAYLDDFRHHPDPVLCYVFPQDGEYEIAIHDSIYRGREDFVYRIAVGELPFITGIYPLGGPAGASSNVRLHGWNLPAETLAFDLRNAKRGSMPLVATRGQTVSNFVPFAVDTMSEVCEKEPNHAIATAQAISMPIIVNGRIDQPGDIDVYRIEGKAGSEVVAEIHARRLNSPLDSALKLTDTAGVQFASNDDHEDKGAGLTTHHADSRLVAKLPADGVYFLRVTDAQRGGSPEHSYRLRVSPPQPDFELRVVPSSLSGRAGGSVPVTIHALRKDGFTGEIAVALRNAPPGFKLGGGNVPAGKDQAKLTITLGDAQEELLPVEVEGRASVNGSEILRAAVPADDMQQAFAYHHLVPAKTLQVAVAGRLAATGQVKIASELPVKIPAGGSARVQFTATVGEKARDLQLELSDPPTGITMKKISASPEGAEIEFISESGKVTVGEKGNLIVQTFVGRAGPKGKPRRIPLGALPAIPFEVINP
jgi:hypothetical protein